MEASRRRRSQAADFINDDVFAARNLIEMEVVSVNYKCAEAVFYSSNQMLIMANAPP